MGKTRSFLSALFFLCGIASFAALPWIQREHLRRLLSAEPFYQCPVLVYSDRILLRSDVYGKGYFGASRGRHGQRIHKGIDLLTPVGNPILASKSGRVAFAGIDKGYGFFVELHHPDGRSTRYAHLDRIYVFRGDWVRLGEKVGSCGKSGNADDPRIKPHLHFEILEGKNAVNPTQLFDPALRIV